MSISYSAITNFHGKLNLPSVEMWGQNTNILRDPPKSIYTRRIDKVSDTSQITQMIEEAGDRINGLNDTILVYPRGINPMVSVDYSNVGNNGGQRRGSRRSAGLSDNVSNSGKQSYLPYRIMDKGAFRPPTRDLRDLLPLSRLPRVWTSSFTNPGFVDFSKKALVSDKNVDYRQVRNPSQMLRPCVKPTTVYKLESPIIEGFEVKNVIRNPLKVPIQTHIQPQGRYNGEIESANYQVIEDPLKVEYNVNKRGEQQKDGDNNFSTERYTHDVLQGNLDTNKSRNIETTSIDDIYFTQNEIKETNITSYTSPQTSYERNSYIHKDLELNRVVPQHEGKTNMGRNIYKNFEGQIAERTYTPNRPATSAGTNYRANKEQYDSNFNRDYKLKPTISQGGMEGSASMPVVYQDNQIVEFDQNKAQMRQRVYEAQQERNVYMGSRPYEAPGHTRLQKFP